MLALCWQIDCTVKLEDKMHSLLLPLRFRTAAGAGDRRDSSNRPVFYVVENSLLRIEKENTAKRELLSPSGGYKKTKNTGPYQRR